MRTAPAAIPQRVGHRPPADQRRLRCRRLRARVVSVCEHMQGLGRDASTFCWRAWCELTGPLHDGEVALRCAADPEGRGIGLAVEAVSRRLRVHAVARRHRRQTRELDERPGHTIALSIPRRCASFAIQSKRRLGILGRVGARVHVEHLDNLVGVTAGGAGPWHAPHHRVAGAGLEVGHFAVRSNGRPSESATVTAQANHLLHSPPTIRVSQMPALHGHEF